MVADGLQFDVCPETGIGCVVVERDASVLKIDLMPDEAASLQDMVKSGDMAGAKALLACVDSKAEAAMDDSALTALAQEIG